MNTESPPRRGLGPIVLLGVGILGISTSTLWARLSESSASELAFRRLLLTVPILWLFSRVRGTAVPGPEVARAAVLVSGLCLAVHFTAFFASLERLPAAVSLVFVSMHPILLLAVEATRRGARFERGRALGVILAVAGTVWLAREETLREDGDLLGIALGLLSALGMVGYLLAGRIAGRELPGAVYASRSYGVAACVLGLGIFAVGRSLLPESGREWGIAGLLALFPTVLGHTPMNAALRHLPATVVSTAFLGEVVGASLLVWWILDEVPPAGFWAGGLAIGLGIVCVALRRAET